MKRSEDLKPCLFCKHYPSIRYTFGKLVIECSNTKCGLQPSTWLHSKTNNIAKLVKIWNTRKYDVDEDLCPHGYKDWDDCPDCCH